MTLPGNKRVVNYIKKSQEKDEWRETCSAEEKENDDVFMEMNRDQYREKTQVDRIVTNTFLENQEYFLVKWKGEIYSACTWETEGVKNLGAVNMDEALNDWTNRNKRFEAWTRDCKPQIAPNRRPAFEHYAIIPPSGNSTNNTTGLKTMAELKWLKGGSLREYQVEGVNWLIHNWCNNIDGILADEMGLGKTIQTVAFLAYLLFELKLSGPFLVIVP
jgi:chromodomain-helicase-DNA-binding protein 1